MPDPSPAMIQKYCRSLADPVRARQCRRYFKTGPGEYGEGDVFLGIALPVLRKMIVPYQNASIETVTGLIRSRYHEERLLALLIWVRQFQREKPVSRQTIFESYLAHTRWINNWDLVDVSAHKIVGRHLVENDPEAPLLDRMAESGSIWERRIAVISTFSFLPSRSFTIPFRIARALLNDPEDLIHKAVGWQLREIGKLDPEAEMRFLNPRYKSMPRTMLRYAIERFDEPLRQAYLKGRI